MERIQAALTCCVPVVLLLATTAHGAEQPSALWEVAGLWSEACPCNPPCPCWTGKKPTFDHCENVQVYQIEKGHYGATPLDGLTVVVAWVSPENEIMDQAANRSNLLAFYVDRSTTAAQRQAIENIWRNHVLKGVKAARGELRALKMKATIKRDHATVTIPGILAYEVKEWRDNPVEIKDATLSDFRQGASVAFRYSDFGLNWNNPGKHAMFATFRSNR
jgi:hypothetical protein